MAVHAKSVRANMDLLPVLDTLVPVVEALPDAILRLDVHDEIFEAENYWYAPELGAALGAYDRHDHVEVRVHPYFTDDELWDYLSSVSVSVLPYRFGTHSGWLEACFDLGTAVVAPSCGFYSEQRRCDVFDFTEESFDPCSLHRALRNGIRPVDGRHRSTPSKLVSTPGRTSSNRTYAPRNLRSRPPMSASLRIALIASNRFPLRQPFAGGLEAHVWHLARALVERAHEVSLFAGSGSDLSLGCAELTVRELTLSTAAQADPSASPMQFMVDHHAYLNLMMQLSDPAVVSTSSTITACIICPSPWLPWWPRP